jgi:nuclear GTP-binding protein
VLSPPPLASRSPVFSRSPINTLRITIPWNENKNPDRTTLKQKFKVLKKVKEHHKKQAKQAKKDAVTGRSRLKKKQRDAGIPAAWPLKEELNKEIAFHKQRALEVEAARKEARARAREAKLKEEEGGSDGEDGTDALAPASPSPGSSSKASDGSRRAFGSELAKVIADSDIVLQVLDARDPASCRCPALERAVLRSAGAAGGAPKALVFLLNKVDLVPAAAAAAWLKHLRRDAPAVAFKAVTAKGGEAAFGGGRSRGGGASSGSGLGPATTVSATGKRVARGWSERTAARDASRALSSKNKGLEEADGRPLLGSSTVVGADALLRLLRAVARERSGGSGAAAGAATVGVVGLPNVGKSSVINSLKRSRVATVGNAPGVTRRAQSVQLDARLTLIDSPGVVLSLPSSDSAASAADLALRGCVKVESLGRGGGGGAPVDARAVAAVALSRCPPRALAAHYRLPLSAVGVEVNADADAATTSAVAADAFLSALARARGKLLKGGNPDLDAAAKLLVADWAAGKVRYYTLPPTTSSAVAAAEAAMRTEEKSANANTATAAAAGAGVVSGTKRKAALRDAAAADDTAAVVAAPAPEFDFEKLYAEADDRALAGSAAAAVEASALAPGGGSGASAPAATSSLFFVAAPAGAVPEDEGAIEGKEPPAGASRSLAGGLFVASGGGSSRGGGDSSDDEESESDDLDDDSADEQAEEELAFEARAAAGAAARARASAAQTPLLYVAEGQFNPHAARAAKKRAKRVSATTRGSGGVAAAAADALAASLRVKGGEGEEGEEVADEPYDFNEAFAAGNGDEGHSSGADEEMGG